MYSPPPLEFTVALDILSHINTPIHATLLARLRNAANAGTLTIFRNAKGLPIGFVCWAGIDGYGVRFADKFDVLPVYPWEFNAGRIALLIFVVFIYPFGEEAQAAFRKFLTSHRAVYYVRKDRKRLMIRTSRGLRVAQIAK